MRRRGDALAELSEEWMFRGVLFQGLRSRLALWPATLLTSALFGAGHVMNVVTTGQLGEASGPPVDVAQGWNWTIPYLPSKKLRTSAANSARLFLRR
jgi:membrane protease YdiL (CAAX protease family)